jgi:hypothetical protein
LAKFKVRVPLENNLPGQLHVEGFAWADTGTAEEIADGIGHKAAGSHGPASGREVDSVKDVEHFGAQLQKNAAGLTHCSPVAGLKLCDTPANGSPSRFKPRSMRPGWGLASE